MIKCVDWPIGVCSWSLGNDLEEVAALAKSTHIQSVNLSLAPALAFGGDKYLNRFEKLGWQISAATIDFGQEDYSSLESIRQTGGIVPDNCWGDNKKRVFDAIDITAELNTNYLEFHFGFILADGSDYHKRIAEKTQILADRAAEKGVTLLMETGQETAEELARFIETLSHPALGVNFDPANMILYDKGKPTDAVKTLSKWIRHFHVKDAVRAKVAGTWGREVPWGDGEVDTDNFLKALVQLGFSGSCAIEREAGDNRMADIELAVKRLTTFSG